MLLFLQQVDFIASEEVQLVQSPEVSEEEDRYYLSRLRQQIIQVILLRES